MDLSFVKLRMIRPLLACGLLALAGCGRSQDRDVSMRTRKVARGGAEESTGPLLNIQERSAGEYTPADAAIEEESPYEIASTYDEMSEQIEEANGEDLCEEGDVVVDQSADADQVLRRFGHPNLAPPESIEAEPPFEHAGQGHGDRQIPASSGTDVPSAESLSSEAAGSQPESSEDDSKSVDPSTVGVKDDAAEAIPDSVEPDGDSEKDFQSDDLSAAQDGSEETTQDVLEPSEESAVEEQEETTSPIAKPTGVRALVDSDPTPTEADAEEMSELSNDQPHDQGTDEILPDSPSDLIPQVEETKSDLVEDSQESQDAEPTHETQIDDASPDADLVARPVARPAEMDVVARQAEQHVQQGNAMAARGASFVARREFVTALRQLAEALDAVEGGTRHVQYLTSGLTALKEADDFLPKDTELTSMLPVADVVGGHDTPVVKNSPQEEITTSQARQMYYTYAQEQLAAVAPGEVVASKALFSLGKLYTVMGQRNDGQIRAPAPVAMVYHHAAILTDARNHLAAHELGVLLARHGRLDRAKELLRHAVLLSPQVTSWRNLALVHQWSHQPEMARLALAEAEKLIESRPTQSAAPIRWVSARELAQTSETSVPPSQSLQEAPQGTPAGKRSPGQDESPARNRLPSRQAQPRLPSQR